MVYKKGKTKLNFKNKFKPNNKFNVVSKKQKKQIIVSIMVIAVIFILILSYLYLIPRTELTTTTFFNENFSGIAVGCKVKNTGNKDIDKFSINIEIRNSTKVVMDNITYTKKLITPGDEFFIPSLQFYGNQFDEYTIILDIEFKSEGSLYKDTIKHTAKDYMNIKWEDKIS